MRTLTIPGLSRPVSVIGQGTWGYGKDPGRRAEEVAALRLGLELGLTLIDTAEYYAAGGAEQVVGEAVRGHRDAAVIVTKVWPRYTRAAEIVAAVEGSLRRLSTEYLDGVLWHWPSRSVPLTVVAETFDGLVRRELVRSWGVSNFWQPWLDNVLGISQALTSPPIWNQMPYGLHHRGVEPNVLPRMAASGMVLMAYSPLAHGRRLGPPSALSVLAALAERRGVTPHQLALAWVVARPGVVALPKAVKPEHVRANAASDFALTADEREALDQAFPVRARQGPMVPPYATLFQVAHWWERQQVRAGRT